jgi:hypothetical protein
MDVRFGWDRSVDRIERLPLHDTSQAGDDRSRLLDQGEEHDCG